MNWMSIKLKRNIAFILFGAAIVLLIVNLWTMTKINKKEEKRSAEYITVQFNKIIKDYALQKDWITCNDKVSGGDTISNYSIRLPKDLPVPLIIQDISNALEDSTIKINVTEQGIHGNSILKISFFNKIKLTAEFIYDKEIIRDSDTLSFILRNPADLSQQELNDLLFSSDAYSFILEPSNESAQLAKIFREKKKEFAVLLSDNIEDIKYKLKGDYLKDRLDISIKEILGSFRYASFYVVDDNSELVKYPNYNLITSEFNKRGINFINLSRFYSTKSSESEAVDIFMQKVKQLKKNEKYTFIIDAKNYLYLTDTIKSLKKQGYKFVLYIPHQQ
jgi:hypothetical protein